jgi:release factor glutamine methyltransferase
MPPPATSRLLPAAVLPDLSHLGSADFLRVYEPSDDTFLLVDALSAETDTLRRAQPGLCVEVGAGSGCVISHLGSLLPKGSTALLATDVNPAAAAATRATAAANSQPVDVALMDLLSALRPGLIDVLVFNPPYVPTSSEELSEATESRDISAAWAGGLRGREVLDCLLPRLGLALSPCGVFYLLGVAENDRDEIAAILRPQGFHGRVVAERRAQNERLWVMLFSRSDTS